MNSYYLNLGGMNLEREFENKIFMLNEFINRDDMEENIKKYIEILKNKYPNAIITREFYKGQNILVRATEIDNKVITNKQVNKEREIDDWYIRQRGER